jgi:DnaJ-class molecular chaperone
MPRIQVAKDCSACKGKGYTIVTRTGGHKVKEDCRLCGGGGVAVVASQKYPHRPRSFSPGPLGRGE